MDSSLVHCVPVERKGALCLVQLLYFSKDKSSRKGTEKRVSSPYHAAAAAPLFLCPLLRFHSPHDWMTQRYTCAHKHTQLHFFIPPGMIHCYPLISPESSDSSERRGKKKRTEHNAVKLKVKRTENRVGWYTNEQFGLQCSEEAEGALCNASSAEHELHDA